MIEKEKEIERERERERESERMREREREREFMNYFCDLHHVIFELCMSLTFRRNSENLISTKYIKVS